MFIGTLCSIIMHQVYADYIQSLCSLHCDCAVNPQHPTRDCCLLVHFVVTVRVGIGVCAERDPLTRWSLRIVTVQRTTLGCSWINFFSRVITQAVTVKCEDYCHTEGVPIRHWYRVLLNKSCHTEGVPLSARVTDILKEYQSTTHTEGVPINNPLCPS